MHTSSAAILLIASLISVALTGVIRTLVIKRGRLDVPNERSSHNVPTPRGGGLAFVVVVTAGALTLGVLDASASILVCTVGGMLIAGIGYADDVFALPALPRLGVHIIASTLVVVALLRVADKPVFAYLPALLSGVILVVAVVWAINLFNFMDGIDGIAASQAMLTSASSAFLATYSTESAPWILVAFTLAGSCLGFLVWNWPPAKIFMGDVGSGFLGLWLAVLAIAFHQTSALPIWTSVLLSSPFIADATTTLIRRMGRGEQWYAAHRSHAYQRLARRLDSHLAVTRILWILHAAVIFPVAYFTRNSVGMSAFAAIAVVACLSVFCAMLGAGRPDEG